MNGSKAKALNNSNSASTADNSTEKIKSIKYTTNSSSLTWKEKLHLFIQNKYFKIYSCIITVICLLLDDIEKLSFSENADLTFDIIHIFLGFLIFIEIIVYFIADETYGFSLFFFIDVVFLASILFEISKIYDKIVYYESGSKLKTNVDRIAFIKFVKILKILRIVRIGKIVTMFNHSFFKKSYDDDSETDDIKEEGGNISSTFIDFSSYKIFVFYAFLIIGVIIFDLDLYSEDPIYNNQYAIQLFSNSDFFKKNIYSALLLFNSYIELLNNSKNNLIFAKFYKLIYINDKFQEKLRKSERAIYYKEYSNNLDNDIDNNKENVIYNDIFNNIDENISNITLRDYINKEYFSNYINNVNDSELYNLINNITSEYNNNTFLLLTENDKSQIKIINQSNYDIYEEKMNILKKYDLIPQTSALENKYIVIYDDRYYQKKFSRLNIIRTIFSISIFLFIYLLFLMNINKTVLSPIETMIIKIKKMSKNPTLISEMSSNENNQKKKSNCLNILEDSQGNYKMNEFQIIENKISKICSLVSFGFGEAGTQIISQVLKEGLNVDINPIIPGKKVMGIYGFCDIRNFTDTTEILKEKVMVFVNQVAEIVHQITADYCGGANKNIGDAFLLVWKFENQFIKEVTNKQSKIELKLKKINRVRQICDLALICFIRILIEINKSFKLAIYRQHKELNARMKNYKTRLGFGLHLGQSIEGAIGSMFKIDASYLSTNVNMANNLEENTKTFKK